MQDFEILGDVRDVETFAVGHGIHIRRYLNRTYGMGRWRKRKGFATVRFVTGTIVDAEIHWFEAHGIGRKEVKIKKIIP